MARFRLFDLNPEQQDAVTCISGPMLILAGAGTGKTRVITTRIAYLIERGTAPEHILAVTFTNKAAREMKVRIGHLVEEEAADAVTACTFHSLCVRILRAHAPLIGFKTNFSIFDEGDQMGLLRKVITRTLAKDESLDPKVARHLISQAKNKGWNPPANDDTLLGTVFSRYQQELKNQNAMDFDDLLGQAVRLLSDHEEARVRWQTRYRHLLVDEFQDTNTLQLELVRLLAAGDPPNVCVVGDDDQSIYGWRGAEISNILEFERHFPRPSVFKLQQNYRSTNAILGAANRLIAHNQQRRVKTLWSEEGAGEPVRIMGMAGEQEEAEFVVSEIAALRTMEKLEWDAFAVLFRMNAQSRSLESELRRMRIPYRVVGGKSFFDRREVKDLLAYLAAVVNPDDDQALLRIISTPPRGIGAVTVEMVIEESAAAHCSVQTLMLRPDFLSRCTKKTASAIEEFAQTLQTLRIRAATPGADLPGIFHTYFEECGYYEDLRRGCKTEDEYLGRESNVREMLAVLGDFGKRSTSGLQGFLDEMHLDKEKQEDKEGDGRGVTLITLHAAKGLEFPHVHLVGAEDGMLPHSRAVGEGNLDEERRLFYVGITRARRSLVISFCRQRQRYGSVEPCTPSRFLEEIEGEGVVTQDYEEFMNRQLDEDEVTAKFARIREMLAEDAD